MPGGDLSSKAQQQLGLPVGFKTYSPFPFGGINTAASNIAVADQEFSWIENYVRLGDGNLRTIYDAGLPLYTAPFGLKVVYFSFYTIATTSYCAIFLSDGSAVQINTVSQVDTTIGDMGFYLSSSGFVPYARQWGTQYLLICNRNTPNDYWAWDGSLLYTAGTAAPNGVTILSGGSNYTSVPTMTVRGGAGSGIGVSAQISGGSVVQIKITAPGSGYEVGDVVQIGFQGGGSDNEAVLTAEIANGGVGGVSVTAPGSNYTTATATFTTVNGLGSGAAGTVLLNSGVTAVTVTAPGSGYTVAQVTFTGGGGGTGATATAVIFAGQIQSITVNSGGSGYTAAPTPHIAGDGTGATATAAISSGTVTGVKITNPGSGYTAAPNVTITGSGSGATAISLLAPAGLKQIDVQDGGTGYTSVPLITFAGGGGAGAVAIAKLTPTSIASVNVTAGGSGYLSAPTIKFISTDGSGAAAVANMAGASVASVSVTNGGSGYTSAVEVQFVPADMTDKFAGTGSGAGGTVVFTPTSIGQVLLSNTGTGYTTAPIVEVTPGANDAAAATIALMPYGVSGSAMETFLSRVWLVNPAQDPFSTTPPGGNFLYSAPGSITDFATSDGGGNATNTDSFLQTTYVNVRQSSGYLYFFGDGSVSVLSNVSTSGTPTVTTYNYQNVDPQAGLEWRDALQDFGRSTLIANSLGIFGLYGGAATKISDKLKGLYPLQPGVTPSAATSVLFNTKHFHLLASVMDPDSGAVRKVMLTWNEKDWTIASQSVDLVAIGTQKSGSDYIAWGNTGSELVPLFNTPSLTLNKRLDTKSYGTDKMFIQKQLMAAWMQASDKSAGTVGIKGTQTLTISGITLQNKDFPSVESIIESTSLNLSVDFPSSPAPFFELWGTSAGGVGFVTVSVRFDSTSPDFILGNWVLGYVDVTALFGS